MKTRRVPAPSKAQQPAVPARRRKPGIEPRIEVLEGRIAPATVLNYAGANGAITLDLAAHTITESGVGVAAYSAADVINISNASSLTIVGSAGHDSFVYSPTDATSGTVTDGAFEPVINFTGVSGQFTINTLAGGDRITINADSAANSITALGGVTPSVQVGSSKAVTLLSAASVLIEGGDGNDTLTINSTSGPFAVPLTFNGGAGFDTLQLSGGTATSSTLNFGPTADAGMSTIDFAGTNQVVSFTGLEPVKDNVTAATLTVNGTNAANAINYTAGPGGGIFSGATGLVAVDDFETVEFNNKTNLVINGQGGDDTISLGYNSTTNPAGLTGTITVNGGGPTGSDTLILNGISGVLDNLRYQPTSAGAGTVVNDSQPQPNVLFTGISQLSLALQQKDGDGVRLDGTTGNDTFEFTHGATADSGSFTGTMDQNNATGSGPFAMTAMRFSGASPTANDLDVNFFNPGGTDSLVFNGTSESDVINTTSGQAGGGDISLTRGGLLLSHLELFNFASATVRGNGGGDTFNHSSATNPLAVTYIGDGSGDDSLAYAAGNANPVTLDLGASTIAKSGAGTVTFSGIGAASLNGSNGTVDTFTVLNYGAAGSLKTLTLDGADTGNNDGDTIAITVTGSGPSTVGFTPQGTGLASLTRAEGGPAIAIRGFNNSDGSLRLNAGAGAGPLLVSFNAAGTTNATTVTHLVSGGTRVSDTVDGATKWVPIDIGTNSTLTALSVLAGAGDDTLTVDSTNGAVALTGGIFFDGGAGFDTLRLTGGSATSSTLTLGPTADAGVSTINFGGTSQVVSFKGLEPVQDNVSAATLTVNGTGASNSISYSGGPGGGIFSGATGLVAVDGFETVEFNNKTNLVINGQGGNDSISIGSPALPAGLNGTITVNGGGAAGTGSLTITGVAGTLDNLRYLPTAAQAGTVINDSQPQPNVLFSGIGQLTLAVQQNDGDGIRLDGTIGNDTFEFAHGAGAGSGSFTGTMDQNNATGSGPFAMTPMSFTGASPNANDLDVNFFVPGGTDTFVFHGTAGSDVINTTGGQAGGTQISLVNDGLTRSTFELFNFSSATIRGDGGGDTFNHSSGNLAAITYVGDGSGNDVLAYTSNGPNTVMLDLFSSTISKGSDKTVTFGGIGTATIQGYDSLANAFAVYNYGAATSLKTLNLNGNDTDNNDGDTISISLTSSGPSTINFTPQSTSAAEITRAEGGPTIAISGFNNADGGLTLNKGAGSKPFFVNFNAAGTTNAATIAHIVSGGTRVTDTVGGASKWVPIDIGTSTTLTALSVLAGPGDDTLTVDNTNGPVSMTGGIFFDGGTGRNALLVSGSDGPALSDIYTPGSRTGEGTSIQNFDGTIQKLSFANVGAFFDSNPGTLQVDANSGRNDISYTAGSATPSDYFGSPRTTNDAWGMVSVDNLVAVNFTNKTGLIINGLGGDDSISINNPAKPTGLANIAVSGGEFPFQGTGTLTVYGTSNADALVFSGTTPLNGILAVNNFAVFYTGITHAVLDGQGGDDTFDVAGPLGRVELRGGGGSDTLDFSTASAGVIVNLDAVGTDQQVNTTGETIRLLDSMENFTGSAFNDILLLKATAAARTLNGGTQESLPTGDTLLLDGAGALVSVVRTDTNTGTITPRGYGVVAYDEFESLSVANSPSVPGGFGSTGTGSTAFGTAHLYDGTVPKSASADAKTLGRTVVATGDLNGDGYADMAVINVATKTMSVLLNNGDGTFGDPQKVKHQGVAPSDIVIADFDGDKNLDLMAVNRHSPSLAFFKGDGTGSFADPVKLGPTNFKTTSIVAADLDGDLVTDLVAVSSKLSAIRVLTGNGDGTFVTGAKVSTDGKKPVDAVVADFNDDGLADVATANKRSNNVSFFAGDGMGGVAAALTFRAGARPTGIAAGDFDNDGTLDLAVSNRLSSFASVLLSAGAEGNQVPQFAQQLRVMVPEIHHSASILTGDFNGDGFADLVLGNKVGADFSVLLGKGAAAFTQPYEFIISKDPTQAIFGTVITADVNNDGLPDILAASPETNHARIRVLQRTV